MKYLIELLMSHFGFASYVVDPGEGTSFGAEDVEKDLEGADGSEGEETAEDTDEETAEDTEASEDDTEESPDEDAEEAAEEKEEAEDSVEEVEIEGKKYVTADAFKKLQNGMLKRIDALTAKSKEAQSLLDDPEFKERLAKEYGLSPKTEAAPAKEEAKHSLERTKQFLDGITDPGHKAFYTSLIQSLIGDLGPVVESYFQKTTDEKYKPLMGSLTKLEYNAFKAEHKDFSKYEARIQALVKEKGLTLEQAYKDVKYDELVKKFVQQQKDAKRKKDLKKLPVGKNTGRSPKPTQRFGEEGHFGKEDIARLEELM